MAITIVHFLIANGLLVPCVWDILVPLQIAVLQEHFILISFFCSQKIVCVCVYIYLLNPFL